MEGLRVVLLGSKEAGAAFMLVTAFEIINEGRLVEEVVEGRTVEVVVSFVVVVIPTALRVVAVI